MAKGRESRLEMLYRHRLLLTVLAIPAALVLLVVVVMPRTSPLEPGFGRSQALQAGGKTPATRFSVVIDAGSTGSRVHIFKFHITPEGALDLQFDKFEQLKPGLSAHAADPAAAAASLKPLLALALETIPAELQPATHVRVGATAGLRLLPGSAADQILGEVRALLAGYPFQYDPQEDVSILSGANEGAFAWLTLNYLLGHLGKAEGTTMAAIDLGGGSVQEAFAMTPEEAAAAPHANYTTHLHGGGREYSVYVYSYLGYGLMAGRAEVLGEEGRDTGAPHPCVPVGYSGKYDYAGASYEMKGGEEVGGAAACSAVVSSSLNPALACSAPQLQCSFNGAWGGGRVPAAFYISSYFWDRAVDAGIVKDGDAIEAAVKPSDFQRLAEKACSTKLVDLGSVFPKVHEDIRPFFCLDLCYVHTLLVEGFRVPETAEVTIVKKVQYKDEQVEAAWPLGAAINSLG